jgi:hypothetical protein
MQLRVNRKQKSESVTAKSGASEPNDRTSPIIDSEALLDGRRELSSAVYGVQIGASN